MPGLRETLEAATPGPWVLTEPEDSWHFKLASIICLGTSGSDDLDLAALAPELAAAHFETLDDIRALAEGEEHLAERAQAAGDMEGVLIHRSAAGALRQIERTLLTRLDAIGKPEGRNDGKEAE